MIEINDPLLNRIIDQARSSGRKRINHNFHTESSDPLQRMIHAMEPDTYVQPHRHLDPDKREVFIIFYGRVVAVEYNDDGQVANWTLLDPAAGNFGVEMTTRAWHSLIALESGSVIYEIKDGPWDPADDKYFAKWAPKENEQGTAAFNERILKSIGLK